MALSRALHPLVIPLVQIIAWTQQYQLLMSLLISSLSEEVLPIIVGSTTSHEIWDTLEKSLASASQTRVLHLTCCLQSIRQRDRSVTAFLHEAKTLADELNAAGKPLSRAEFNLYIFKELHSNFKDLVTTLASRPDHVSFSELHSLLLSHEFLHNDTSPLFRSRRPLNLLRRISLRLVVVVVVGSTTTVAVGATITPLGIATHHMLLVHHLPLGFFLSHPMLPAFVAKFVVAPITPLLNATIALISVRIILVLITLPLTGSRIQVPPIISLRKNTTWENEG